MRRITLSLSLISLMVLGVQLAYNTESYPGFHDGSQCGVCHNEPAVAWNSSYANVNIVADGVADEVLWAEEDDRTMYIPLAMSFGSPIEDAPLMMRFQIAQNATHIAFLLRMEDPTIDGSDSKSYSQSDAFALLFNIDMEEFMLPKAAGGWSAMSTITDEGGSADLVIWKPASSADGTEDIKNVYGGTTVAGHVWDSSIGGSGTDNNDWTAGALHGNVTSHYEEDYQVELVRPLVTADAKDVQFKYDGYYEFAAAYWNDTDGKGHWVSFEHTIWVHGTDGVDPTNLPDPVTTTKQLEATTTETIVETKSEAPFNGLFGILGLISVSMAVLVINRRK